MILLKLNSLIKRNNGKIKFSNFIDFNSRKSVFNIKIKNINY